MVVSQWHEVERYLEKRPLSKSVLSLGRGGKNVAGIGLADDIEAASQVDRLAVWSPSCERDPLRIVAV